MYNMLKKIIAIVLIVLVVLLLPVPVLAEQGSCGCGQTPVIILPGYGGSYLFYQPEEGVRQQVWPPVIDGGAVRSIADIALDVLPRLIIDAGGNADHAVERFGDLLFMLDKIELGPDGTSLHPTDTFTGDVRDFRWDVMVERGQQRYTNQQPITESLDVPHDHIYKFFNDWRLSHVEGASRLHEFIRAVMEDSGHDQVSLFAISHGGQLATAYFHLYGGDYIDRAVLLAPAIQGSTLAIDMFEDENFAFDPASLLEVLMIYIGRETALGPHFHRVHMAQLSDVAVQIARTYLQPIAMNFGSFWDLVPPAHYERLKAALLCPVENARLIEQANVMHHEIMPNVGEIFRRVQEQGTRVSIIAGSGLPLVGGNPINSDYVIEVASTTGARALPVGSETVLPGDHLHLSPDGLIDASEAYLPRHTWFFHRQYHGQAAWDVYARELYNLWLFSDEIEDVFSDPRFPQFRDSANAVDGLSVRFSGNVSGFLTAESELLLLRNLSAFEITLLSVTAQGHDFTVPLASRITLRPGETKRLRYETILPDERQQFTLQLEFVRELNVPSRETRQFVFTAIPADEDIPRALRFEGDVIPAVPLRFYPVRVLLIVLALGASLTLASLAVGVIYKKSVSPKKKTSQFPPSGIY